jgi:hypothetical protein
MSTQRIGRVDGDRFVDERKQHDAAVASGMHECASDCPPAHDGYVSVQTIDEQQQRAVGVQQLDTIEHVAAALDVETLDWSELDKLFDVGQQLIERWLAETKRRGGIA